MKGGDVVAGGSFTIKGGAEVRSSINQYNVTRTIRNADFYGLWKVTPKTSLRLTLSNLLREEAIDDTRYVDANRTQRNRYITPGRMNIGISVEMKL